jgi:outer membrane protein OmpA-like peptidoglycan-associated protein
MREGENTIAASPDIPFELGSSELGPEAEALLGRLIREAEERNDVYGVRVTGYGDARDASLASARVLRVLAYLVQVGVPREMVESRPDDAELLHGRVRLWLLVR